MAKIFAAELGVHLLRVVPIAHCARIVSRPHDPN